MPRHPVTHPYSDHAAFERFMLLIAVLVQHPGIGGRNSKASADQDALESVQTQMKILAHELGLNQPIYSIPTLRKDLATLRQYGILQGGRYDWGYYLGTGAFNRQELQLAIHALAAQANYQGDPRTKQVYQALAQRLKGLNLTTSGALFYPVRTQFNRAIVHTDPEEMAAKRQYRDTLFHCLETLETAIVQGLPVKIRQARNPYQNKSKSWEVYPLQLLYHDIAWYLICEDFTSGHLSVSRVDRFKNYLQLLNSEGRGIESQWRSLQAAHQLLENGWGLFLGEPEEQRMERQGSLTLIDVKVRFFPPVTRFIAEGERRHPKQKIRLAVPDKGTGEAAYLDYMVKLPARSLDEFSLWINRFMSSAQVLAPTTLVEKHKAAAMYLIQRYQ
jgi:predicted DNA-binding transcriptional regulator YafY